MQNINTCSSYQLLIILRYLSCQNTLMNRDGRQRESGKEYSSICSLQHFYKIVCFLFFLLSQRAWDVIFTWNHRANTKERNDGSHASESSIVQSVMWLCWEGLQNPESSEQLNDSSACERISSRRGQCETFRELREPKDLKHVDFIDSFLNQGLDISFC